MRALVYFFLFFVFVIGSPSYAGGIGGSDGNEPPPPTPNPVQPQPTPTPVPNPTPQPTPTPNPPPSPPTDCPAGTSPSKGFNPDGSRICCDDKTTLVNSGFPSNGFGACVPISDAQKNCLNIGAVYLGISVIRSSYSTLCDAGKIQPVLDPKACDWDRWINNCRDNYNNGGPATVATQCSSVVSLTFNDLMIDPSALPPGFSVSFVEFTAYPFNHSALVIYYQGQYMGYVDPWRNNFTLKCDDGWDPSKHSFLNPISTVKAP